MKYTAIQYLFLALLSFAPTVFADAETVASEKTRVRFGAIIAQMGDAASSLRDATYLFHKQEYVDGKQRPAERIAVNYRAPNDIYMKWLGPIHQGRELVFRPGWNDDRLRVSPGPWLPTLNLDPHGYLAMRGNRHDIYQLPFPAIVANFVHSAKLIAADPALQAQVSDLGEQRHYGEMAHCYRLALPRARQPKLYAAEVMLCISLRTGLPLLIKAWEQEGGQLHLVEDYGYENVKTNVGLSDRHFNPDNPAYDF